MTDLLIVMGAVTAVALVGLSYSWRLARTNDRSRKR
jgi:hypothetical protein